MFWRFGGYANISTLDSILDKPDVTVEELLDESDLIQELKQQNSKLIEFLRDDNVLQRLLQYVTAPKQDEDQETPELEEEETSSGNPLNSFFSKKRRSRSKSVGKLEAEEETKEEKQRMKYAYVACEILSCDVWSISEAMLENRDALHKFWEYLNQDAPLDPVQAGYFQKVNDSLFDKKTEEMIEVLKSIDNVVPNMLKHVDCPTIMDLLLKIISMERSEGGQGIVDWLQTQNLIPLLLSNLSPDREAATQTSAGDFLKAIITISANATAQDTNVIGPNELTRQLVSEECVQTLITDMLRGGNTLTVGVGIIIEVIRKNNSDYDLDNQIGPVPKSSDPIYLGTLLRCFAKNVTNFMDLIGNASQKKELKVAFGEKIEPLGFDRFKTCELMAELLHCSNMALLNERGSEAEVKRRDAERERLKAEGKLSLAKDSSEANNEDDFGTSVDSSGFHHARAPSLSNESPEEIKRPLEVSNGNEDEFENVTASEANVDDMKDSFDDKEQFVGEPLERSPRARPRSPIKNVDDDLTVAPLSPKKPHARSKSDGKAKVEASDAKDADSPTSAGLTDRLNSVELDKDTVMEDSTPKNDSEDTGDQPLTLAPDMDDDKPAPLFSGKRPLSPSKIDPPQATSGSGTIEDQTPEPSVETNPSGEGQTGSVTQASEDDDVPPYELDIDGQPVVGDLLKMKFVEHHVVPTILDFFFRFPWNNFLHNVVYDVVQQVFNGQMNRGFNRSLAIDLFETGRITERIVEGQQASDKAQKENNMRLGYMGHLTLIAEEVVKFTERHPPECLSQSVLDKVMAKQWVEYVEQTLAETRERDNAILGGVRPDMSVGPRQAVLNAVNAAQGYGGSSAAGTALSGLSTGTGAMGLDTAELTSATGNTSSGGYLFSGSSLLSGFNHGSSDEEDEEMEGSEQGGDGDFPKPSPIDDQDQATIIDPTTGLATEDSSTIAPLNVPPSRARRQFAARLAARRKEAEAAAGEGSDDEVDEEGEEEEGEENEDDELVRLHREDSGEDLVGGDGGSRVLGYGYGGMRYARGSSSGDGADAGGEGDFRSDDSLPDSEGEDVGIVMRKSTRASSSSAKSLSESTGRSPVGQRLRLGDQQRRNLFSLDRGDGGEREGDDDGDGDDDIELGGDLGQGEKERIVEAFERLGIDVRTPEGFDLEAELEEEEAGGGAQLGEAKVGEELAKERQVGI